MDAMTPAEETMLRLMRAARDPAFTDATLREQAVTNVRHMRDALFAEATDAETKTAAARSRSEENASGYDGELLYGAVGVEVRNLANATWRVAELLSALVDRRHLDQAER